MTALDLTRLKALAQAATPGPWTLHHNDAGPTCYANVYAAGKAGVIFGQKTNRKNGTAGQRKADLQYAAAANPAVVLELVQRLERAEAVVQAVKDHREMYAGTSDELNLTGRAVMEALALHSPDPNDPLDDVLPLAVERVLSPQELAGVEQTRAFVRHAEATFPLDDAGRQWKAPVDQAHTEGGSHD